MGINPMMSGLSLSGAQATQVTPFGFATATVDGMGAGNVQIGQFGVASSLNGPMPITPENTVNRLGVASPFATPFGSNNPINFQSFGAQNPFSPLGLTPMSGFNPLPFGSFGPNGNPLSPIVADPMATEAWMGTNGLMGQSGFGPMFTDALGVPQAGAANNMFNSGFGGTSLPGSTSMPTMLPTMAPTMPAFDTSSFFGLLQSGFGTWMLEQLNQLQNGLSQLMGGSGMPAGMAGTAGSAGPAFGAQQPMIAPGFVPQAGPTVLPMQPQMPGMMPMQQGFGMPLQQQMPGIMPMQQGFGMPMQQQMPGMIPLQQGFGMPMQQQMPGMMPMQQGFGMPMQQQMPGMMPMQQGFGMPLQQQMPGMMPMQQGFGMPMQQQMPGMMPMQQGFGMPMQQQMPSMMPMQQGFGMPMQQQMPGMMPMQQGFGMPMQQQMPGMMTPNGMMPVQSPQNMMPTLPQQGMVNPFAQQMAAMGSNGGTGGQLVSPLGTFITSIGPMGGNANAGFLGAQASGQAMSMVLSPLNPAMIVDYANPFYNRFNFNIGFFAT